MENAPRKKGGCLPRQEHSLKQNQLTDRRSQAINGDPVWLEDKERQMREELIYCAVSAPALLAKDRHFSISPHRPALGFQWRETVAKVPPGRGQQPTEVPLWIP